MWAALSKSKIGVKALKDQLGELSGQQSRDMEVRSSRCRAANAERLSILYDVNKCQVATDCATDMMKSLMKGFNKLMDAIEDKVEEAAGYRNNKEEKLALRQRPLKIRS